MIGLVFTYWITIWGKYSKKNALTANCWIVHYFMNLVFFLEGGGGGGGWYNTAYAVLNVSFFRGKGKTEHTACQSRTMFDIGNT